MIEQLISKDEFIASVNRELTELISSAKEEYAGDLQKLSEEFAGQCFKLFNATTESDRKRAETNIRHIKASLTHISARMGLDVTDRLIKICTTILSIAAAAAIKAII